ncbi:membrane-bound serine protease (ClpP class) [Mangrovibacterium marinum]|uniref:Membrane-bound serine protease (ClpP class) n=2 Tax=Mangrovibacterium marinum TaxID=1639118 RepID=A0A2T5C4T0_9BACT|nr:membrane-bound serine protease (ClpP class) [Mangrovibacterium marinum]
MLFVLCAAIAGQSVWAQPTTNKKKLVYQLNIKQNIMPKTWRDTQHAFAEADSLNADLLLIHMNTYGGTVLDADSIRTKILNSPIPVYVFIDNNAASAGALISIACDSIYMRKGGSIGAATVVNQTGEKMPDKYQSYMRSIMRATAESHGGDTIISGQDTTFRWFRDPKIAEAMVDERVYIAGITDTGKVLTFTPAEAIKHGYCEGTAESIPEVLRKIGVEEYEIVEYQPSFIEKIIGFLVNPIVSGLLIMAIIGGIYFELQTPGIGFPLGLAIVAAVAYFAPLYLEGLAANWEILLFIIGLILIAIEIFVLPGFGIAGMLGILFTFTGLVLSLVENVVFNFENVKPDKILTAMTTVIVALFAGFLASLFLSKELFTAESGVFRNLSLHETQEKERGFVGVDTQIKSLQGKSGVAYTVLRPSGKVQIEGKIYDAVSNLGMIDKGEEIVVVKDEAAQLYVEKMHA